MIVDHYVCQNMSGVMVLPDIFKQKEGTRGYQRWRCFSQCGLHLVIISFSVRHGMRSRGGQILWMIRYCIL